MDISPAIVSAITAALAVPLFLALMRRIKSFRHIPACGKSFEQLAQEYRKWEYLAVVLTFLLVALIAICLWVVLDGVYRHQLDFNGMERFVIGMPSLVWFIPSLFFALFIAAIPLHFLYLGLLGRRRYVEYIEYGNQKFRIDSWKLFRYLGNLLLPLCLVMTLLALDTYARVTDRAFVVNDYFGIGERSYRFDQISRLELIKSFEAPNGNIVRNPYYVVTFDDGEEYDFRRSPTELNIEQQHSMILFISGASDLKVETRDSFPAWNEEDGQPGNFE